MHRSTVESIMCLEHGMAEWTFLTNHAHVLLVLTRDSTLRMRDIAAQVGITERAVHRIIHELTEGGYLTVEKVGRRNQYVVHSDHPMRHPVEAGADVADLIALLERTTV